MPGGHVAPCGHPGVPVIGRYVTCPTCDREAAPEPVEPEKTAPWTRPWHECRHDWTVRATDRATFTWRCRRCQWEHVVTIGGR